jgi:putative heme transporter
MSADRAQLPVRRVRSRLSEHAFSFTWKALLVVAIGAGGLWTATHGVAGVSWRDVAAVLRAVTLRDLVLLALIWLGGLGIYSVVLAAALPGLGLRRSLLLNLSGSAVANVVPLGGAAATALNWRMVRTWGHSNLAFVAFCVLTNALDVLTKLLLPLVGVLAFVLVSLHVPTVLWLVAASCAGVLLAALAALRVMATHSGGADGASAGTSRWRVLARRSLRDSGERIRALMVLGWARLLSGSAAYIAAQVALLFVSLRSVGLDVPLTVVIMAAAIERLGTLIPLTPGGTGVAEIGTIAWLVATGLDPVQAVAGVLLYRVFLVVMEIPLGGVLLAGWAWLQRSSPRHTAAGAAS